MTSAMTKKCLLVLLDGLADRACPELGDQTPLQRAATPNLDRLASLGACGYFHATWPGQVLPSEEAHFSMMGYDQALFPGRGYLEGLGEGFAIADDEVALLAHFSQFEARGDELILLQSKPKLPTEQGRRLFEAAGRFTCPLGQAVFHQAHGPSGVLVLSGRVAPYITDSDPVLLGRPLLRPRPWASHADDPASQNAADLLAAYLRHAHQVLKEHPLNLERQRQGLAPFNAVRTQRAGRRTQVTPLEDAWGLKVLSLSSAAIYRGLFQFMGARAELLPEAPSLAQDMRQKLELACSRLAEVDFIHLHTKAPDEAGHAKDPWQKVRVIEELDQGLAGLVELARSRPELLLVVTGDHATPCQGPMVHSGENSPLLMAGCGVWRDGVTAFNEVACAQGALGLLLGPQFMASILALLDRGKLKGYRDDPRDLPYYPGPDHSLKMEPV